MAGRARQERPRDRRGAAHHRRKETRGDQFRDALDSWFPTLVRYAGLGLMAYSVFADHLDHVALVTAASGMILFKSVWGRP